MALRNLVIEGDPLLRKTSRPVEEISPRIIELLDDMADSMYFEGRGIGIAAPQVGVLRRVFIVDVGDEHGLIEFINPEIIEMEGSQTDNEGCLSVPGKTCAVERPQHIKVKALNRNGEEFELEADDLLARCICHELAHLDGHLYPEVASEMMTNEELERREAEESEEEE